jgi:putative membrane protein
LSPKSRFSEDDLARIGAAVAAAENGTSGEIVPVFVESSGPYTEAAWRGGTVLGAAAVAAGFLLAPDSMAGHAWTPLLVFASAFAAGTLAALVSPALLRLLAPRRAMDELVSLRAEAAFTREQVFATRDRTGILIFVSLLERKVRVLADSGIHAKVADGTWDTVVAKVVSGMKAGRPADGIVEAVDLCGQLLRQHGFAARPDDTNELPDSLRVET